MKGNFGKRKDRESKEILRKQCMSWLGKRNGEKDVAHCEVNIKTENLLGEIC